jgi:hypothetical protein
MKKYIQMATMADAMFGNHKMIEFEFKNSSPIYIPSKSQQIKSKRLRKLNAKK